MRFYLKLRESKYIGKKRIIEKFALFPVIVRRECRWLEYVKIEQEYCEVLINMDSGYIKKWVNINFID